MVMEGHFVEEPLEQNVKVVKKGEQWSMLQDEDVPEWALSVTLASPGPWQQGIT